MKALLRISTVVVLSGAGVVLSAGAVVSEGVVVGSVAAFPVICFASVVCVGLASMWLGAVWVRAGAARSSTATAESGITYIRRFIRSPLIYTSNFSTNCNKTQKAVSDSLTGVERLTFPKQQVLAFL